MLTPHHLPLYGHSMPGEGLLLSAGGKPVIAGSRLELRVGSDPDCDLVVGGAHIRPVHLVVRQERGLWVLHAPDGGAFLDDEPVERVVVLSALEVRLGDPVNGPLVRLDPHAALSAPATDGASVRLPSLAGVLPYLLLLIVVVVPVIVWAIGR